METEAAETTFLFVGNQLCLDFINTEIVANGQRVSLIHSYEDLTRWLLAAGAADATDVDRVEAAHSSKEKEQIVIQAMELRATLRRMVEQITAGQIVSNQVIDAINGWLEQSKGYRRLSLMGDGYATIMCYEQSPGSLLAPITEAAADLLVHADLKLVRKCENPQCILCFYDTSKNHARRWCSMDICGNRMKVAAHYWRRRHAATGSANGS